MTTARARKCRRAAGFTLVEILAVIAILGLLAGLTLTVVTKARASANLRACQLQLQDMARTMQLYVDERCNGKWPHERGIKFLLKMAHDDYIRKDDLKKYVCPSTDDVTTAPGDDHIGSGFKDWDAIDPDCISYAGRDNLNCALKKDRASEEILASDDNWSHGAGRANHDGQLNIVYADGHVDTIQNSKYKTELPEGQDWLPVGPDSPDENLKKLWYE